MSNSRFCPVLEQALMFRAWGAPATRPTWDIDLLARLENTVEVVVPVFRDMCGFAVEPDGIVFDPAPVAGTLVTESALGVLFSQAHGPPKLAK